MLLTKTQLNNSRFLGVMAIQANGKSRKFELRKTSDLGATPYRVVFGEQAIEGFREVGFLEYDPSFETVDKAVTELGEDLSAYFANGPSWTARLVITGNL